MSEVPVLQVTSHIDGKNALVRVFPDRVEWERGKSISGAKLTAAVLTAGMSAAVTGGVGTRKGAGVEMIPMRSISSVTQKRDTMINDLVTIITSGNIVELRCARAEAVRLRQVIMAGINGQLVAPAAAPAPVAPLPPQGPPAGWYADQDPAQVRWWDGTRWTGHVRPK